MRISCLGVSSLWIVLWLSACSSSQVQSTLSPTEMPASEMPTATVLPYYPLDTLTGIAEIDGVLEVISSDDPQQLHGLIHFTKTTCMTVNALGGPPPCRPGEAEGAPVEVLPFLGAEGSFLRKDEAGDFPGLNVSGIYAIYQVSETAYSEENYPAGDYGIMLVGEGGQPDKILQVRDGKIVRIDYVFDNAPYNDRLLRDASGFILAPKQ